MPGTQQTLGQPQLSLYDPTDWQRWSEISYMRMSLFRPSSGMFFLSMAPSPSLLLRRLWFIYSLCLFRLFLPHFRIQGLWKTGSLVCLVHYRLPSACSGAGEIVSIQKSTSWDEGLHEQKNTCTGLSGTLFSRSPRYFCTLFWAEALTTFVLNCLFKDVWILNSSGRGGISLQSKGEAGLISRMMKRTCPSDPRNDTNTGSPAWLFCAQWSPSVSDPGVSCALLASRQWQQTLSLACKLGEVQILRNSWHVYVCLWLSVMMWTWRQTPKNDYEINKPGRREEEGEPSRDYQESNFAARQRRYWSWHGSWQS